MNHDQNRINNRRRRALFGLLGPLVFVLLGIIVMWLWNAILPDLLSVKQISYWQALGLFLLCRILFGGFGFRGRTGRYEGGNGGWGGWRSKWHNMTEEERANFREQWRKRCEERKTKNQ